MRRGLSVQETFGELFQGSAAIDGNAPEAGRVNWEAVPGKGCVYLLVAEEAGVEKAMLLATVGDLRAALRRRLGELPPEVKSKRVEYGRVCTRVYWRRVDSSFAANWWYWRAARAVFPESYKTLVPWMTSWWVEMEREGAFPRLRRTSDLSDGGKLYVGPIRDRAAAGKLIETVEDLFDLCRYHVELVQAPLGRACAYKEMGKCPAPCDGSVPAGWYREQMGRAWGFLTGETRGAWFMETEGAMRAAAGRLEFEVAGRVKQRLARAAVIYHDAYMHMRGLGEFSYLALQPGKTKLWVEPWVIHGGRAECLPQVEKKKLAEGAAGVMGRFEEIVSSPAEEWLDEAGAEQVGIVAHHLARGEEDHGIYLARGRVRGVEDVVRWATALMERKAVAKPLVEQASDREREGVAEVVALPVVEGGG